MGTQSQHLQLLLQPIESCLEFANILSDVCHSCRIKIFLKIVQTIQNTSPSAISRVPAKSPARTPTSIDPLRNIGKQQVDRSIVIVLSGNVS